MPNIIKIRQCFVKLQLKMSGMFFFETHCGRLFSKTGSGNISVFY